MDRLMDPGAGARPSSNARFASMCASRARRALCWGMARWDESANRITEPRVSESLLDMCLTRATWEA